MKNGCSFHILIAMLTLFQSQVSAQWSVDVMAGYRRTNENFDGHYSNGIYSDYYIDTFSIDYRPRANGIGLNCNFWWKKSGFFPFSVGINQWNENFTGTVWRDYLSYFGKAQAKYVIDYQGSSQYLQFSIGAGHNIFPETWPVELVAMVRLNPEILISRKTNSVNVLASEWDENHISYSTNSYDYNYKNLVQFDRSNKLTLIGVVNPSASILVSGASKFGMSFSMECGAKLQNFSRLAVMEAVQKPYSIYTQFNLGYRFQRKEKSSSEILPE